MKHLRHIFVLVAVLAVVLGGCVPVPATPAVSRAIEAPSAGAEFKVQSLALYPTTALTGSTTAYTNPIYLTKGSGNLASPLWSSADIFATTVVTGSGHITITAQYLYSGSTWVDGYYELANSSGVAVSNPLRITSSHTSTNTVTTENQYFQVPAVGTRLRFKIEHNAAVTPTLNVLLRQ